MKISRLNALLSTVDFKANLHENWNMHTLF